MKWQHAKRINYLIISITSLLVLIVLAFKLLMPNSPAGNRDVSANFDLGMYDLMSQSKEVYNVNLQTTRNVLLMSITSPDDNRIMMKGKLTPTKEIHGRIYFTMTPIFYGARQSKLMIDGLADQLMNSGYYWMEPVSAKERPIVVGQNGAIFLHPLPR